MRFPIKHSTETSSSTRRPSAPTVKSPSVLGGAQTTTVVPRETHQHLRSYRHLTVADIEAIQYIAFTQHISFTSSSTVIFRPATRSLPTSIVLPNWPLESSKVSSLHQIAEDQNSRVPAIVREHFTNGKCSQLESDLKKATEEIQRLKKGFEDELAEKEQTLEGERKDLARQLAKLAQDNENLQAEKLRLSTDEKALHQQQNAANQRVKEAERRIKDADRRGQEANDEREKCIADLAKLDAHMQFTGKLEKALESREKGLTIREEKIEARDVRVTGRDKDVAAREKEIAVREKEVAARENEVANSGIDNLVREALQKIGVVAEDAKVKLSSQQERQGKHFDDVSRSAKQQLADLHEQHTKSLDDVCQAAKQQLTSQGGHSDSLKQDIKTVVDSMNSLAINSQDHADALAEDVKGNAQGHFDTLFQKLDELPHLFPVDRYTEWQKVDIDLTSIIEKVDAVKADLSNLTRITTSTPSQQLNRGKRPSETSLEASERSQRRRSSQQDPATSRPESPLSSRMTTRGQTQTQTRPQTEATSTGPQTQVQVGPVQGQAAVNLPPGTAPSAAAAPIWNQISFVGQNWTNEKLALFLGHVESY
ncbi:MAG: hypothetical protein Q9205_003178, partial [Flavoplaca limonia]